MRCMLEKKYVRDLEKKRQYLKKDTLVSEN